MVVLLVAATLTMLAGVAQPSSAHGKELDITVDSLVPDPDRPLRLLYRATIVYVGDRDPVEDASVVLTARQAQNDAPLPPLSLTQVAGAEGVYVGEVVFDRFGDWDLHLDVEAALGLGDGSVDFTDEVRPEPADPALDAARRVEAERVASLQLLFGFEWWPDVVTVMLRVIHSVAGLAYFVVTGLVLVLAWFGIPTRRPGLLHDLSRRFLPIAGISLGALLLAGLYEAAFDAPVAWPGIYDLPSMLAIPYGDAYLVAFALKVVSFGLLVVMALRIGGSLKAWDGAAVPDDDVAMIGTLKRQTLINAAIGLFVLADVAVVIYLHYISHLGVFVV
jgi:hypothetical protein